MSYEIRAMSLGEVLDTAFRLLRDHTVLLVGAALTLSLPAMLLQTMAANLESASAVGISGILGLALFLLIVTPIASAAITHALGQVYLSRPVGFGEAFGVGLRLWLRLVGTAALMGLLILAGLLLLIIPGIYLMLSFMLVYQVIVLEGRAGWNALSRSRELSKGHLMRIMAIYLVATILMAVIGTVLGLVTTQIPLLNALVQSIVQAVFTAYMSAGFVVVYFDIRCRKEAFDLEHLAQVVIGDSAAPAVAE